MVRWIRAGLHLFPISRFDSTIPNDIGSRRMGKSPGRRDIPIEPMDLSTSPPPQGQSLGPASTET